MKLWFRTDMLKEWELVTFMSVGFEAQPAKEIIACAGISPHRVKEGLEYLVSVGLIQIRLRGHEPAHYYRIY